MITINGKVFRNLEEQVAYLSEIIPLFEEDNGELVIKQGDGTEIARIVLNDIANISISTANDIATLTMTYNDGTTATQTIDMTSYLKKNTTITNKEQAYIKNTDGTQGIKTMDDQASNGTLVLRTSTGRINSVDPQYDGNVATKKYVDDTVSNSVLFENIKDSSGNYRFIEGDFTPNAISGITFDYHRWSLSGTHLMIVLAGFTTDSVSFTQGQDICEIQFSQWIADKIYPTSSNIVDTKQLNFKNTNGGTINALNQWLLKDNTTLKIQNRSNDTVATDRYFRLQFDLLIDNE